MATKNFIVAFCCLLVFTNCSDYSLNLGKGYKYRYEGLKVRDIFHEYPSCGGEIPNDVISFDYDAKFIIVKQKPELPQDILYEREYDYSRGPNAIYYWLILKDEQKTLGPMNSVQFDSLVVKYKVPKTLDINRTTH